MRGRISAELRGVAKGGCDLSVGFGSFIAGDRVAAITSTESSPIPGTVQEAGNKGALIDATQGRRLNSVVSIDDGRIPVSGLGPETLAKRMDRSPAEVIDADAG